MKKLILLLSVLFVVSCSKDPIIYTLTTSANPSDGGTVSPSTQQYDEGKTATINATPSAEYVFQSWSGATGSSNSTSVVMNSDKSVTANFVKKKYALTTTVEGEGTVSEKVIKAGAATDYNSGTIVELTAVPSGEWLFVEWTGDLTGSENPTQITIDKAKAVTAVFVKKQYPLTIEIEGEGTVAEKVIKAGVATDYNSGTIVELTAEPTGDWEFVEWTGDISSTENPVQITIDEAKTVKAKFMRYFDYNKPSYFFKTNHIPNFDRISIATEFGYTAPEYGQFDTGVAYADFNDDGYLDIAYAINDGDDTTFVTHFLALNDGNGGWKDGTSIISNSDYKTLSSRKTIVGDFNGDKKPDVVRPTGAHRNYDYPYIMLSTAEGYTFKSLGGYQRDSHTVSSGDIDNDGDLDLFFSGETSDGGLFGINDGQANFTWILKWDGEVHEGGNSEMIDLNKDGDIDLIYGAKLDDSKIKGLNILWGDGTGDFSFDNSSPIYNNFKSYREDGSTVTAPDDLLFSDFDGDGYIDVVTVVINLDDNSSVMESFKGSSDYSFVNNTSDWFDNNNTTATGCCDAWVWLYFDDRDNNGSFDLYDPSKFNGQHFEWNGSMFIRK
ncbi:VCBS repeat-containing protein [Flavobacteriaceae bacterium]|nr:VCBS repeat-containing protein [Flavobacteriaceae bacterium]